MQCLNRFICSTLSLLVLSAAARAETTDCTEITSVPYAITAAGVYCLKSSLTLAPNFSNFAIRLHANDVTVDLNGHTLDIGGSDFGTYGISSSIDPRNVTVRNGTIRGGYRAVYLDGASASGNLAEQLRAEGNGILVGGNASVIRNNVVIGTSDLDAGVRYGIHVSGGHPSTGMRVSDNVVVDPAPNSKGEAGGIRVLSTTAAVIERNIVSNTALDPSPIRYGIYLPSSANRTIVAGNRVTHMRIGILSSGPSNANLFVDNTASGTSIPFQGGVMAGSTNYSF